MKDLRDKIAFITGGASGIGLGMAKAFGHQGMKVMIADIEEDALGRAVNELRGARVRAEGVVCDVAERGAVRAAAEKTLSTFGKVHVVCNNAGVAVGGQIGSVAERDWAWIIDVNLKGVVWGVETFVPLIERHGEGGHIINTASLAGHLGFPGAEPYAATKFAVVGMSEGWAAQLAPKNIGVSILCPGYVSTRIAESARARPERFGGPAHVSARQLAEDVIAQQVAAGMDAGAVGERVVEAIKDDELYVFTHTEYRPAVEARYQRILAAFDRSAASPALSALTARKPDPVAPAGVEQPERKRS